jgi:adenylate cyclase
VAEPDFEAEGLLEGLSDGAREGRLALLRELHEAGVPMEELRDAVAENRLVLLPVERVFDGDDQRYSSREIAEQVGVDLDFQLRLLQALGVSVPDPDAKTRRKADLEATKRVKLVLDAGIGEEQILENARVIGMAMSQLAASNVNMIGESFVKPGASERDLGVSFAEAARTLSPVQAETLKYVHDLHLRESISQVVIAESELEGQRPFSDDVTVAFADMVGFTRLGEQLEVEEIGKVTGRLGELATTVARPPVRLVKMIGDAAMLVSPKPEHVLEAVLTMVETAAAEEIPSLRAGVACGQAVGRAGDWYGRPVNLAARMTAFARPDSVVVQQEVRDALDEHAGLDFSFVGKRHFKGIKGEIPVHRARRATAD